MYNYAAVHVYVHVQCTCIFVHHSGEPWAFGVPAKLEGNRDDVTEQSITYPSTYTHMYNYVYAWEFSHMGVWYNIHVHVQHNIAVKGEFYFPQ